MKKDIAVFPVRDGVLQPGGTTFGDVDELCIYEMSTEGNFPKKLIEKITIKKPKQDKGKLQLFMDIVRNLEGQYRDMAVDEKLLVKNLLANNFTEEEARKYIRRMLREASIYESKIGAYNTV